MNDEIKGLVGIAIGGFIIWLIFFDGWHSKLIYAVEYGVPYDRVTMPEKKPHDCDWETAPLGNKNCHYEIELLSSVQTSTSTKGTPIVSYDEGKTWFDGAADIKPAVVLMWAKIED